MNPGDLRSVYRSSTFYTSINQANTSCGFMVHDDHIMNDEKNNDKPVIVLSVVNADVPELSLAYQPFVYLLTPYEVCWTWETNVYERKK